MVSVTSELILPLAARMTYDLTPAVAVSLPGNTSLISVSVVLAAGEITALTACPSFDTLSVTAALKPWTRRTCTTIDTAVLLPTCRAALTWAVSCKNERAKDGVLGGGVAGADGAGADGLGAEALGPDACSFDGVGLDT